VPKSDMVERMAPQIMALAKPTPEIASALFN
jgi:malic enzyme